MTIHAQPTHFERAASTTRPPLPDHHLIALCRRAGPVLVEDERRECRASKLGDALMLREKPTPSMDSENGRLVAHVKIPPELRAELTAARRSAKAGGARSRKIVGDIAALPATTIAGLKAKCRAMKACIDTGYGHHDEFERLAISIYEDGARLPAE